MVTPLIVTIAGPSGAENVTVPLVEADEPGLDPAGSPASLTSVPGASLPGTEVIETGLLPMLMSRLAVAVSPSPSVNW